MYETTNLWNIDADVSMRKTMIVILRMHTPMVRWRRELYLSMYVCVCRTRQSLDLLTGIAHETC